MNYSVLVTGMMSLTCMVYSFVWAKTVYKRLVVEISLRYLAGDKKIGTHPLETPFPK